MIKEAIEYIQSLANGEIIEADGRNYSVRELVKLPSPSSMAKPLEFNTLTGLADYINAEFDGNGGAVVIVDQRTVHLVSKLQGEFRQRETLAIAKHTPHGQRFQYGYPMEPSKFVVDLQTHFEPHAGDRHKILSVVGNLRAEGAVSTQDDGVSQTVEVKTGVARVAEIDLPNPVHLAPYRTFDEIYQPTSPFVLRISRTGSGQAEVALFETGAGAWRNEAIKSIKDYLGELIGLPIFA